jgi:hypothetical protein
MSESPQSYGQELPKVLELVMDILRGWCVVAMEGLGTHTLVLPCGEKTITMLVVATILPEHIASLTEWVRQHGQTREAELARLEAMLRQTPGT